MILTKTIEVNVTVPNTHIYLLTLGAYSLLSTINTNTVFEAAASHVSLRTPFDDKKITNLAQPLC